MFFVMLYFISFNKLCIIYTHANTSLFNVLTTGVKMPYYIVLTVHNILSKTVTVFTQFRPPLSEITSPQINPPPEKCLK